MSNREMLLALRQLGPEKELNGIELCPCCDSLSPGIAMGSETIVHYPMCHDKGMVTIEEANRWRREIQEKYSGE